MEKLSDPSHNLLPEMLKGLGLTVPGGMAKRGQELMRMGEARLLYVPPAQTAKDLTKMVLAAVGAGALGWLTFRWLRERADDERYRAQRV